MPKVKKEVAPPKYPSHYGTHLTMIDQEATAALGNRDLSEDLSKIDQGLEDKLRRAELMPVRYALLKEIGSQPVIAVDDYGPYQTQRRYIDCGLADPNRCDYRRVEKYNKEKDKDKK